MHVFGQWEEALFTQGEHVYSTARPRIGLNTFLL